MSKYNQIRQRKMREYQPDEDKLIAIASLIRRTHNITVHREPFLLFERDACKFVKWKKHITKWDYDHHITHNPDLLIFIDNTMWVIEIDGPIHDTKSKVIKKDQLRNEHYELSGINHMIFNEQSILYHTLGITKIHSATAEELWPTINEEIIKLLPVC